ncbi:MAG: hypothetical protein SPE49_04635 [Campylobacter sp.]|uniref:hypothetical protein n=1 Tax=Campylobacter sp. TaxID=205 RepID=UPI002A83B43E|nr:hypothetical protein [Campylobacter sp.]MDY5115239.1 hypothetical protein [Campylobacter sp.]
MLGRAQWIRTRKSYGYILKSSLASLIESGAYGIQYLDFKMLTNELEKDVI